MKRIIKLVFIDILVSLEFMFILGFINFLTWKLTKDIFFGYESIGGLGSGKTGYGILVLYDLNRIQFDYFSFVLDFLKVIFCVSFVMFTIIPVIREYRGKRKMREKKNEKFKF